MIESQVAIVIPCYKPALGEHECISYKRIWDVYGHLPIFMLAPVDLDTSRYESEHPDLKIERFRFWTLREYSQVLLQSDFYERFRTYKYIFIYQLDCYILSDELLEWCGMNYDYVGAPLFHGFEPEDPEGKLWRVGNGGLSLRKVGSALRVLASQKRFQTPAQYWTVTRPDAGLFGTAKWLLEGISKISRFHNDLRWATLCNFNEDIFWSVEAKHFWPEFKLPGVETGLRFAFDYAPAYCFEQSRRRLPFACHAWQRYDLAFWKQYIPEAAQLGCR